MFLPCACAAGKANMYAGNVLDVLSLLRVVVAVGRRERNNHWVIYLIMATWSILWIPALFGG
jgi:hypothetical protein